jgi:hypothetical protein
MPSDDTLTVAAYVAGPRIEVYLEHLAVGGSLPDGPLFLRPDRYVDVPLERTYLEAYRSVRRFWQEIRNHFIDKRERVADVTFPVGRRPCPNRTGSVS